MVPISIATPMLLERIESQLSPQTRVDAQVKARQTLAQKLKIPLCALGRSRGRSEALSCTLIDSMRNKKQRSQFSSASKNLSDPVLPKPTQAPRFAQPSLVAQSVEHGGRMVAIVDADDIQAPTVADISANSMSVKGISSLNFQKRRSAPRLRSRTSSKKM